MNKDKIKLIGDCHKATFFLFLLTFFGLIIPSLLKLILIFSNYNWQGWSHLLNIGELYLQGDFVLYSIALITSSIYILVENQKKMSDGKTGMIILSIIILLVAVLLYTALNSGQINTSTLNNEEPDFFSKLIKRFSWLIFLASLLIFYYSNYIQRRRYEHFSKALDLYKEANSDAGVRDSHKSEIDEILKQL